jgi:hypothetical protein
MYILRIEHPAPDFGAWKKAFDSDPVGRQRSGVRRYRILRATDDPAYVMVDLEFDSLTEVEAMHRALLKLWGQVEGKIIGGPKSRIVEVADTVEYQAR